MKRLIRLGRAEWWKMRHSLLLLLHILIPAAAIVCFLGYYALAGTDPVYATSGYLELLSCGYPLIISVICSMSIEAEERGSFQNLLGTSACKNETLLAKWTVLSILGLAAVMFAIGGFAVGHRLLEGESVLNMKMWMFCIAGVWIGALNPYLIHLFLNLKYSKSISMCVGVTESLIVMLFLTAIGEGRWIYLPCSWGSRFMFGILSMGEWSSQKALAFFRREHLWICLLITVLIWSMILLWYYFYEGRKSND